MRSFFLLLLLTLVSSVQAFVLPPVVTFPQQTTTTTTMAATTTTATLHQTAAWQSHVSTHPDASTALTEILSQQQETGTPADLAFLFVSPVHVQSFPDLCQRASKALSSSSSSCKLLSIVGGGVVGGNTELDEPTLPGMALLTGTLPPGTTAELFSFNELDNPPPAADSAYWKHLAAGSNATENNCSFIVFIDPWCTPMDHILESLSRSTKNAVVTGGISVPTGTGPTIGLDGTAMPQGSCVGLCFKGNLGVQAVVAQGCQPVGPSFTITACDGNVITELDSKPALQTLEQVANAASPVEQQKISSGLVCGIASPDQEDYLVRQIMGFVPGKNGIAIGSKVEPGDRFRFHVRDKAAAEEDMQLMIQRAKTERLFLDSNSLGKPVAALQISCVARGRSLFGCPNVDLENVKQLLDDPVVGGFYANGEIGPVGIAGFSRTTSAAAAAATETTTAATTNTNTARTYLHGFTTVAAVFCDYSAATSPDEKQTTSSSSSTHDDEPVDAWG